MKKTKRLLDIIIAGLTIIISLPIMILVAIAIKLDSPGPILYGTKCRFLIYRIGLNGKPFRYYKFRSMVHDEKRFESSEVTKVGRVLRRYHLDELPELFIVLSGHMSLVGPRPLTRTKAREYPASYRNFLVVRPGVTGASQISGARLFSPEETTRTNLNYIKDWTITKDLIILLLTPLAIIKQLQKFPH